MEMDNLASDCDSMEKQRARLSERIQALAEWEKLKPLEMENLARDHDSVEKQACSLERTQALVELEKENLRSSEQKGKCLDTKLVKMGDENEDLRREKFAANQTKAELRLKLVEADQVVAEVKGQNSEHTGTVDELRLTKMQAEQAVEELKRQNFELIQTVDELSVKKMEADEAAQLYKSRLESLEPRIMNIEAELANVFNVNVEDLANLAAAVEGDNVDLSDISNGGKDSLENSSTNRDAENVAVVSPGVRSTSNSVGSGGIGLPKKDIMLPKFSVQRGSSGTKTRSPKPTGSKSSSSQSQSINSGPVQSAALPKPASAADLAAELANPPLPQLVVETDKGKRAAPIIPSSTLSKKSKGSSTTSNKEPSERPSELEGSGGKNLVRPWTKEDGANTVPASPGSESGCSSQ